jgi:transcriptional regulator with XRE-family HTH domain
MRALERVRHNIVRLRTKKGMTQEKLAYESDMSKGYLSEVERGLKGIGVDALEKLAETLDVDIVELLKE